MLKPKVDIEGQKELRKALKQVEGGISDLKGVNLAAAEVVATEARGLVPRRTGRLESTIRAAGQAAAGVVRSGTAAVRYAGPIHFGWPKHNIAPQPFLYDALDARHDEVIEMYEERVQDLIRLHGLD